jgi:hypothetical protein
LESDSETAAFQQAANRRRCNALAQGGYNTTGNKNILRRHPLSSDRLRTSNVELVKSSRKMLAYNAFYGGRHVTVNVQPHGALGRFPTRELNVSYRQFMVDTTYVIVLAVRFSASNHPANPGQHLDRSTSSN